MKMFLHSPSPSTRQLASIIGCCFNFPSSFPWQSALQVYRKRKKSSSLQKEGGNFEAKLSLNKFVVAELCWWLNYIPDALSDI